MDRIGENSRGKANLKRWVLSFDRNVESDNELQVYDVDELWNNNKITWKG